MGKYLLKLKKKKNEIKYVGNIAGQDHGCEEAIRSTRGDVSFNEFLVVARGISFPFLCTFTFFVLQNQGVGPTFPSIYLLCAVQWVDFYFWLLFYKRSYLILTTTFVAAGPSFSNSTTWPNHILPRVQLFYFFFNGSF